MTFLKAAPLAFALALGILQVVPVGRASLPTGCSTGQIPSYNATTRVWGCAADASGGGNVTYASAYASPPGSPASGDMWYPTDSPSLYAGFRYSGSAWVPNNGMTLPGVCADFTWVNQGTATCTDAGGAIVLTGPVGAGDNHRMLVKTAPATPYTITAAVELDQIASFNAGGVTFRQSSDGKAHTLSFITGVGVVSLKVATAYYTTLNIANRELWWFQISDDGANRISRYSLHGPDGPWRELHSVGRTDFLTADQVGFLVNAENVTYVPRLRLLSWKVS